MEKSNDYGKVIQMMCLECQIKTKKRLPIYLSSAWASVPHK